MNQLLQRIDYLERAINQASCAAYEKLGRNLSAFDNVRRVLEDVKSTAVKVVEELAKHDPVSMDLNINRETWGIVELTGGFRVAGKIRPASLGGVDLIRVDVPETKSGSFPAFTKLFTESQVTSITPTDKERAVRTAEEQRI